MDWLSIAQTNLRYENKNDYVELDVQRLIIEPLLQWLGYNTFDFNVVKEQVSIKNSGQKAGQGRADYTINNNNSPVMILEAKALSEKLEPQFAKQILDYCNYHRERPRLGVLTNGLEWQIYDSEAKGSISERCILKINIEENLQILRCLRLENIPSLIKYANVLKSLMNIPEESKKYVIELAYKDFVSTLIKNKEIKQTVLHEKEETTSKNINIPKKAIASYGKPPIQGTKPSKLIFNNKSFELNNWSNVLLTFVVEILKNIDNPNELEGWAREGRKVSITKDKSKLIRAKDIGYGLFLSTNYTSIDQIKIIDALIDKYNLEKNCYWVE